jgi:hypothetical protein
VLAHSKTFWISSLGVGYLGLLSDSSKFALALEKVHAWNHGLDDLIGVYEVTLNGSNPVLGLSIRMSAFMFSCTDVFMDQGICGLGIQGLGDGCQISADDEGHTCFRV